MSSPHWTPAPKRGIIPLRPLDFGTILGKSFAMLRHNPSVLLGFGVCTQLVVGLLGLGLFALIFAGNISRLARIHRCRFEAGDFSGAVTSALSGHVGTSGP